MSDLFEEGEFDNCADVLDDWFNSCNIQGVAEMETVEINELIECMRDIEKRKQAKVDEQRKHIDIMATALSEIKATDDGNSDQEVGTILSWSIEQIAALKRG